MDYEWYIKTAQLFGQSGHFIYDGWSPPNYGLILCGHLVMDMVGDCDGTAR